MDRLTCKYEGENVLREFCTFDRESETEPDDCDTCFDMCKEFDVQGCESCPIQKAVNRLSAYEDIGLTPERLKEFDNLYLERCNEINRLNKELLEKTEQLKEYKQLEEQGRVLVLPCKVGDTVYTVPVRGKKEIIEKVIRDVEFRGIKYKEGERFFINASATPYTEREIGKYLFFSKEEAEQALERMSE